MLIAQSIVISFLAVDVILFAIFNSKTKKAYEKSIAVILKVKDLTPIEPALSLLVIASVRIGMFFIVDKNHVTFMIVGNLLMTIIMFMYVAGRVIDINKFLKEKE